MNAQSQNSSPGSLWNRWEPHIHTPGTVLNDQYKDGIDDFLSRVEQSEPRIKALGITDYYLLDSYERILAEKKNGRLPEVELIFPNVELRFGIETAKGKPINFHLLVSPEQTDHVDQIRRLLSLLHYKIDGDTFTCEKDGLIRLGKKHDNSIKDDRKALEAGANQFKVSHDQLFEILRANKWAVDNILIAVSGGTSDGTPGIKEDSAFASLRQELERRAHIIFSSNENQRKFWSGNGKASKDELKEKFGGLKACLHGSDAHDNASVGNPDQNRYCWLKGSLVFETLRQACIEPDGRVYVGEIEPLGSMPSYTIDSVQISNSNWLARNEISLNPGLVTIIGPRGSGKTALADILALGGKSSEPRSNEKSFLNRADEFLRDEAVTLKWGDGDTSSSTLRDGGSYDFDNSRVQYLSQQFVDQLCSSEGVTDALLDEIERVVFECHSAETRMGAFSFSDLRNMKLEGVTHARSMHEEEIRDYTNEINDWRKKRAKVADLEKGLKEKQIIIEKDKADRQALVNRSGDEDNKRHLSISTVLEGIRGRLDLALRKHGALVAFRNYIADVRTSSLPNYWRTLRDKHPLVELSSEQWESLRIDFKSDPTQWLNDEIDKLDQAVNRIRGQVVTMDTSLPLNDFSPDFLTKQSFNQLLFWQSQLDKQIGVNKENASKYKTLSEKIIREEAAYAAIKTSLDDCRLADTKIPELITARRLAYQQVFAALLEETNTRSELYLPLKANLESEKGALGKLAFYIYRTADVESWAEVGENLLDLRKDGDFKGRGALLDIVRKELQPHWESGTAEAVADALYKFVETHRVSLEGQSPYDKKDARYIEWSSSLAEWLFSTSHISVRYGIRYDNVDIQQLSSGTRGIVLLLLYLAVDKNDFRPLIIDQPEENLDPKSIYDELVPRFKETKQRRQIIVVTHNANLVVNTDADQIIVASCGDHRLNALPVINYESGGLEDEPIRKTVIEILEGGKAAFQDRADRLRIQLTSPNRA